MPFENESRQSKWYLVWPHYTFVISFSKCKDQITFFQNGFNISFQVKFSSTYKLDNFIHKNYKTLFEWCTSFYFCDFYLNKKYLIAVFLLRNGLEVRHGDFMWWLWSASRWIFSTNNSLPEAAKSVSSWNHSQSRS